MSARGKSEVAADGFTPVGSGPPKYKSRDEIWADATQVGLAQNAINEWYLRQTKKEKPAPSKDGRIVDKELVVCVWIAIGPDGKLHEFETDNWPSPETYKKATAQHKQSNPQKGTVCAEDVMFAEHPSWAKWTLYSATYNFTHGRSWPACSAVGGGCQKRLRDAGISEPYRNGARGRE